MPKLLSVVIAAAMLGAWQGASPAVSGVAPLFEPGSPGRSPFPSDRFTVPDDRQITGRRVNLPMPADCMAQASECEDIAVLNQLDGFNLDPRITIPFSGEIDPATAISGSIFLVRPDDRQPVPWMFGINHVVWDPETLELSFRPERALDEHTRYAVIVTAGVTDSTGRPITVATPTRADRAYRRDLLAAEAVALRAFGGQRVIGFAAVSVFTTQTVSHMIARVRDAVRAAPPPRLDFGVGPDGVRAIFAASEISAITNNLERKTNGPLEPQSMAQGLANLRTASGAVRTLAFGTFRALDFTARPSGHVLPIPTRTGALTPHGSVDVAFNVWLPSGARPAGGWPVAIFGHGSYAGKNAGMSSAAGLASHGIAVISIHAMGHGGGARTTLSIELAGGKSFTVASPGLGYDADGDGSIDTWEPARPARPHLVLNSTGTLVQTVAQYLQLVRAIQTGVDVDGDGAVDLDPSRIYYYGQSLGSVYGMSLFAFEPAVRAAVFAVPPGSMIYNLHLSPALRSAFGQRLSTSVPPLINSAQGLTTIDGVETGAPYYNENLPPRFQDPLVNRVPGARGIQRLIDRLAWAAQVTNTVAIASKLRRAPLPGLPVRPFLVQMARSDQASTNPPTSDMIRAGGFADRVAMYRHDLNFGSDGVPANPHLFMTAIAAPPAFSRIAVGAQQQIATFFESDGKNVISPTPAELWEMPIKKLPDDLLFMPRPR